MDVRVFSVFPRESPSISLTNFGQYDQKPYSPKGIYLNRKANAFPVPLERDGMGLQS
jgi:hypothetical protein